jgi:hypothetical protein
MIWLKTLFNTFIHKNKRYMNQGEAIIIVRKWLEEFKDYLPPKNVSEHAKGAHDAVNDLESWLVLQDTSHEAEAKE